MSYIRYGVSIRAHGEYAKTKGIISPGRDFIFSAPDHDNAYKFLSALFQENDKRPLAGKSYLYKCVVKTPKKGQEVIVASDSFPKGYPIGFNDDGTRKYALRGKVSEVINSDFVSVEFPEYHTKFVDFSVLELATSRR